MKWALLFEHGSKIWYCSMDSLNITNTYYLQNILTHTWNGNAIYYTRTPTQCRSLERVSDVSFNYSEKVCKMVGLKQNNEFNNLPLQAKHN